MNSNNHGHSVGESTPKAIPTVSANLQTGEAVELIYHPEERKTAFVVWKDGSWKIEKEIRLPEDMNLVPYSARNNLIQNGVVLFPSGPEEYQSDEALLSDIESYIHRYVDVSPIFEKVASYYVLLSWVYDSFHELPYLRLRGEPGSGKTRFLQIVGSICYKPIFASGASSISPLFRILDRMRGTLIIDESDFRMSDEKAEMVKIFNNGNVKGFPVLRSEMSPTTKEYNPIAYHVFGPKIVATRGFFEDRALESRFLTEEMGLRKLRDDIEINLPEQYKEEARGLRNKLLLFRFRNLHRPLAEGELLDRTIEPRLNQIFSPLLSVIEDQKVKASIRDLARSYNQQMIADRGMDPSAQVLEVIREITSSPDRAVTIQAITYRFYERFGNEYERRITPKWIGFLVRTKLGLKTRKSNGTFTIMESELPKLDRLYERYGMRPIQTPSLPPEGAQHESSTPQRSSGNDLPLDS